MSDTSPLVVRSPLLHSSRTSGPLIFRPADTIIHSTNRFYLYLLPGTTSTGHIDFLEFLASLDKTTSAHSSPSGRQSNRLALSPMIIPPFRHSTLVAFPVPATGGKIGLAGIAALPIACQSHCQSGSFPLLSLHIFPPSVGTSAPLHFAGCCPYANC